jgi:uncharacterized protein (TIGR02001 family)
MAWPARAQLAASVSADSEEVYRGLSLSDGKPVVSVAVAYDHMSGAYAGGSVIGVEGSGAEAQLLGYVDYIGYSARLNAGLAWDAGAVNARYTEPTRSRFTVDYTEFYAGLVADNVSAHLYYSPSYFGGGAQTLYVDLAGAIRPARRWRLFGHMGALTALAGATGLGGRRAYVDVRAGVAFEIRSGELRLAWTTVGPKPLYPIGYSQARAAIVVGATYAF